MRSRMTIAATCDDDARLLPQRGGIAQRTGVLLRLYDASHAVELADAVITATAEHHGPECAAPSSTCRCSRG